MRVEWAHGDIVMPIGQPLPYDIRPGAVQPSYPSLHTPEGPVVVTIMAVSGETGLLVHIELQAEYPNTGRPKIKMQRRALQSGLDRRLPDSIIWDSIWCAMITQLLLQELWEVKKSLDNGEFEEYRSDSWNWLDWGSIFTGYGILWCWYVIWTRTEEVEAMSADLPGPLLGDSSMGWVTNPNYAPQVVAFLDRVKEVTITVDQYRIAIFAYTMIISLRFFKGFQGQAKLAITSTALLALFVDVMHMIVIFAFLFVNFAITGSLLFGREMKAWSSVADAIVTSTIALRGDFEFDRMYELRPIAATCWFFSYIAVMAFLLLSLITGIVVRSYSNTKMLLGTNPETLLSTTIRMMRDYVWRVSNRDALILDAEVILDRIAESEKESAGRLTLIQHRAKKRRKADPVVVGTGENAKSSAVRVTSEQLESLGLEPLQAKRVVQQASLASAKLTRDESIAQGFLGCHKTLAAVQREIVKLRDLGLTSFGRSVEMQAKLGSTIHTLRTHACNENDS